MRRDRMKHQTVIDDTLHPYRTASPDGETRVWVIDSVTMTTAERALVESGRAVRTPRSWGVGWDCPAFMLPPVKLSPVKLPTPQQTAAYYAYQYPTHSIFDIETVKMGIDVATVLGNSDSKLIELYQKYMTKPKPELSGLDSEPELEPPYAKYKDLKF